MGMPVSGFPNQTALVFFLLFVYPVLYLLNNWISHRFLFFGLWCRATQEDELGVLYLTNIDFLKNGVPASIIATLVSSVHHPDKNIQIIKYFYKGCFDGWILTDETHRVRGTWKTIFKPRDWRRFLDCELIYHIGMFNICACFIVVYYWTSVPDTIYGLSFSKKKRYSFRVVGRTIFHDRRHWQRRHPRKQPDHIALNYVLLLFPDRLSLCTFHPVSRGRHGCTIVSRWWMQCYDLYPSDAGRCFRWKSYGYVNLISPLTLHTKEPGERDDRL